MPLRDPRPSYTDEELKSFLPLGWHVIGQPEWDDKRGVLTLTVIDPVEFDWPVHVSAKAVAKEGRLGAFKSAIDDVYRQRLGRHTRGLGMAG